jgi:hypothetical protein
VRFDTAPTFITGNKSPNPRPPIGAVMTPSALVMKKVSEKLNEKKQPRGGGPLAKQDIIRHKSPGQTSELSG